MYSDFGVLDSLLLNKNQPILYHYGNFSIKSLFR